MQIKNMFEKQIDRDIKGVIKVGQSDEENVYQELENSTVEGKRAIEYFTGRQSDASIRPKIEDPMLIAEMTKAGTIESDVMLFNIDSKGSANTLLY